MKDNLENSKTTTSSALPGGLRTCLTLFWSMLTISTFTFGGGFVIISLMKKKFVEDLHWLTEEEVLDLTAIAQSAPGALAVNAAIIFGYRIKKLPGAIAAVLGTIIPPVAIISLISICYEQFRDNRIISLALQVMRAGVAAVIFDVVITLIENLFHAKQPLLIILAAAAFTASFFFQVSSIVIILICAVIGLLMTLRKKYHTNTVEKGGRAS